MKHLEKIAILFWISGIALVLPTRAQGYGGPLNMHGLHQRSLHAASMRAFAGIAIRDEIGVMFHNPAALYALDVWQFSLGAHQESRKHQQVQHYAPVRYYPNLSLLLEGLAYKIPDPDTALAGFSPKDTVQRPFDSIGPNWERSRRYRHPLQGMIAGPVGASERVRLVAGLGVVEYANLDHYYQHNNVLNPPVLSQRPLPTPRPTDDNPLQVDWSQFARARSGALRGMGGAFAVHIPTLGFAFGVSGLVIRGSTDDWEQEVGRGKLTFFANAFRVDSVYRRITRQGTSDFKGQEFTLSGLLYGQHMQVGIVLKPPMTFFRTFSLDVTTDTGHEAHKQPLRGKDQLWLPWRGWIELILQPRTPLRLGMAYEVRPYGSARYTDTQGSTLRPWTSANLFRVGAEVAPTSWLRLRGGLRGEAEVFAPEGAPLMDDAVSYEVYSMGFGVLYARFRFDLAYEYAHVKYQDVWASALSKNSTVCHTLMANFTLRLSQ